MDNPTPFAPFSQHSLFLVWGPPSHGPRSRVFARELGIEGLYFLYSTTRRGLWTAPFKYTYQAVQTLRLLFHRRPKIVFMQSPPSFAVLFVYLYCALTDSRFVVDAHSAALQLPVWTWPHWLHRFLARQAVVTIVTNEYFQQTIQNWGGRALVLHDIPTTFKQAESYPLDGNFNVMVVNTFSRDEPLCEILAAAANVPDVQFHVTGRKSRASEEALASAPANVHFTDFLPDENYYALMAASQAVMCLTTRDHTMQRGACEALSLGRPILTSAWPLLREYFHEGTVHVPNTSEGIRQGVEEMKDRYDHYRAGIQHLQIAQRQEWQEKVAALTNLIQHSGVKT
jgi:glycosyltransferase involved in cell wall biosynthesis